MFLSIDKVMNTSSVSGHLPVKSHQSNLLMEILFGQALSDLRDIAAQYTQLCLTLGLDKPPDINSVDQEPRQEKEDGSLLS